jgi:hypothetical protein
LDVVLAFLRGVPVLDVLIVVATGFAMFCWWKRNGVSPDETPEARDAGATAVTNQINALLTAASIVLAGSGSVLAIGLGKEFPRSALEHLIVAAGGALLSIVAGVYTLGYIPSVIHVFNVARKRAVMVTCFVQMNLVIVATVRFLLSLWQLSRHLLTDKG